MSISMLQFLFLQKQVRSGKFAPSENFPLYCIYIMYDWGLNLTNK